MKKPEIQKDGQMKPNVYDHKKTTSVELSSSHNMKSPHLSLLFTEQHDLSQVSCSSWEAEGAHAVFWNNIHAGAELEQQWDNFLVTEVTLDAKHWCVVQDFCAVIHVCPSQHQETAYLIIQAKK